MNDSTCHPSGHGGLRWASAHGLGSLGEMLVTQAACESHLDHEPLLRPSLSPHTPILLAGGPGPGIRTFPPPVGLTVQLGRSTPAWGNLPPASSATSCLYPHSPAGEKSPCLPEEKPKGFLGIGASDVIFLVCGKSLSFCKVNTTRRQEHSGGKKIKKSLMLLFLCQSWLFSLVSHADLLLLSP